MSHATPPPVPPVGGLRERKRQATHQRIADEAARLVADRGVDRTTVDDIAAAADVARSTFFRYFDTKEIAVAEGFTTPWLTLIVEALEVQPADLSAMAAVTAAFGTFASLVLEDGGAIFRQSQLSQSTPALRAWTLQLFTKVEEAIAKSVAARLPDLREDDPRPRMIGALTMAAVRLSTEQWLASDGTKDLPRLVRDALTCVTVTDAPAVHPEVAL